MPVNEKQNPYVTGKNLRRRRWIYTIKLTTTTIIFLTILSSMFFVAYNSYVGVSTVQYRVKHHIRDSLLTYEQNKTPSNLEPVIYTVIDKQTRIPKGWHPPSSRIYHLELCREDVRILLKTDPYTYGSIKTGSAVKLQPNNAISPADKKSEKPECTGSQTRKESKVQ